MLTTEEQAELDRQVSGVRLRMLLEPAPRALLGSGLYALLVAVLVQGMVPGAQLWPWLAAKLLALLPRWLHARAVLRQRPGVVPQDWRADHRWMLAFMALDGLFWGALVWWLTPVYHRELAMITVGCVMGLAAVAAMKYAVDTRSVLAFAGPMLLPNAAYFLTRQDLTGAFGAVSVLGFLALMYMESWRTERRVTELLRLRFGTERVAAERARALEQARLHSDAKSRFLATVSHEMRTPLHGVLGLTRVLQQEQPRVDQRPRLALIERSGEHLLRVINDILDFSKIEAGRMTLERRPFDLTAELQEAASVFQVLAQRKQIALNLSLAWEGACPVMGDAARVRQVLHNLLGNAVKFTQAGSVTLAARALDHEGRFEIVVQDTGPGIAEHDRERIFEAFTQSEALVGRQHAGTGLGLSIARQLCQAMDGSLACDSAAGEGAIFRAVISLQREATDLRGVEFFPPPVSAPLAAGATVLLVEDNAVNVMVAEAMLANLGCVVVTAGNGMEAVSWLDTHQCDVVLMDCAMPVMDGFEATREIRRRERAAERNRVPIVALTANLQPQDRGQCLAAGMDDHLVKPFTPDDIRQVLVRVLANAPLLRTA